MIAKPTKFQEGSFVTLCSGAGTPFKIEIAVHFSAFGDVMPVEQQCEAWNVYAFRDEHGRMVCALESELEQWTPQNDVEFWICQDITRLWPRYLQWQHVAELLGAPVEALIGRERVQVS